MRKEDHLLLESYLERSPTPHEIERYFLTKKKNFAELCIFFHYFSLKFNPERLELDDTTPLKEWSQYMKIFSERKDEMEKAQFFYDLARWCLKYAR